MKILLLLLSSSLYAKNIHLVFNVPYNTPRGDKIYLTGNELLGCQWQAACHELIQVNKHTFEYVGNIKGEGVLEFKVTRGSWRSEGANSQAIALPNYRIATSSETSVFVYNIHNWKDQPAHTLTGRLEEYQMYSKRLDETRTIRLWQTPGRERIKRVLIAHDGQNLFDPLTSTFNQEWNIDEHLDDLYRQGNIPATLVIGIDSGVNRSADYDYLDKGKQYLDFIASELLPKVLFNKNYLLEKDYTMHLIGSSFGAYISFAQLMTYPDLFHSAVLLSFPAFGKNRAPLRFLNGQRNFPQKEIYIDHGTAGGDRRYAPWARLFLHRLYETYERSLVHYQEIPFATHTEADWSRRVKDYLQKMLK